MNVNEDMSIPVFDKQTQFKISKIETLGGEIFRVSYRKVRWFIASWYDVMALHGSFWQSPVSFKSREEAVKFFQNQGYCNIQ